MINESIFIFICSNIFNLEAIKVIEITIIQTFIYKCTFVLTLSIFICKKLDLNPEIIGWLFSLFKMCTGCRELLLDFGKYWSLGWIKELFCSIVSFEKWLDIRQPLEGKANNSIPKFKQKLVCMSLKMRFGVPK